MFKVLNKNVRKGNLELFSGVLALTMIAIWILLAFVMANWTDGNIEFLIDYIKGNTLIHTQIPLWISFVLNIFFAPIILLFNIIVTIFYYTV